nr:hypothetical protein [Tanacetum cinerariifolium]
NLAIQQEQEEQAAQSFTPYWNFSMNNEHSIQYKEYLENSSNATTTVLPTEEPEYSLSMGYEHLNTTPEMESDEVIKSSAKNLVPIPSECEDTFDDESECDVPVKDESSPVFTTFSNPLFDCNDDFTSSDDESLFDEDVLMEDFKVYSNHLFDDDEINSDKIDPHCFNIKSDLIESLSNRDTLIDSSPKFDYLEEFSGELCLQPSIHFLVRWKIFMLTRLSRLFPHLLSSLRIVTLKGKRSICLPARMICYLQALRATTMTQKGISIFLKTYFSMIPFLFPKMKIPSGEIKVHIEVLWGNRLPIRTVRCRCPGKDLAKITKKWQKPDKIEHEIVKNAQKPDPKIFSVQKSNQKVKSQDKSKIAKSGTNSANPQITGQITYPVASLTLNSARSYVMQSASFIQGMISSIPIGGSISLEGFVPSILLLVVIIVTVVIVVVILVVIVVAIVGVVIVVVGGVSSIIKLLFMIIGFLHGIVFYYLLHQPLGYGNSFLQILRQRSGWAYAFHQNKASSVRVPVANVTLFSSAQLLRENIDSVRSNQQMSPTAPFYLPLLQLVLPELWQHCQQLVVGWQPESWLDTPENLKFKTSKDRYGDNRMSDSIGGLVTKVGENQMYENYLCNLCGNNSHDGYDCQQQFPFVCEQEPSYNQNYDEINDEVFQADHSEQNTKSLENSSTEIAVLNSNEEKEGPSQDSDIRKLIREECNTKASEEQKQIMEDTVPELVKICQEKEFLCIHDNADDLIKSALNSKLLLINSNCQRLDNEKQEVKNVIEQPAERGNRSIQSLQNFRVVHKNSISFKNTSKISSIHVVATIISTKEPEHSLSMRYEHLSITPEMESNEVTESNAKNLLPIPSECEVTLEDEREYDVPISKNTSICDDHSDSKIDDDISVYDDDLEDIEYVEASLSDLEIVNQEEENVVQQEEEEVDLEDISQIQDVVLREKLLSITRIISNLESLNDNSTPDRVLNSFESDNYILDNFLAEFETFCDHSEKTRSGNTTHADNSLPEYDSFCFEIEPNQERLINLVKNDIPDNSSNDPLLEEADLFFASDNSIPPGIKIFADDPEGDIRFLEELLIDDSILSHQSSNSNFKDNPSIPQPPPEPPDAEIDTGKEILVVMNDKEEDVNYSSFIFVIFDKVFSLISVESEDTIFDPGISN